MKKYTLILALFVSVASFGQGVDSTKIPQTITISLDKVCYVKDCLGNVGEVEYVKFYREVVKQMDTTYNPQQAITMTVPSWFIRDVYAAVSRQPEGVANPINDEIKAALLPQLTNAWLLAALQQIGLNNAGQRQRRIDNGFQYFKAIKQ